MPRVARQSRADLVCAGHRGPSHLVSGAVQDGQLPHHGVDRRLVTTQGGDHDASAADASSFQYVGDRDPKAGVRPELHIGTTAGGDSGLQRAGEEHRMRQVVGPVGGDRRVLVALTRECGDHLDVRRPGMEARQRALQICCGRRHPRAMRGIADGPQGPGEAFPCRVVVHQGPNGLGVTGDDGVGGRVLSRHPHRPGLLPDPFPDIVRARFDQRHQAGRGMLGDGAPALQGHSDRILQRQ